MKCGRGQRETEYKIEAGELYTVLKFGLEKRLKAERAVVLTHFCPGQIASAILASF